MAYRPRLAQWGQSGATTGQVPAWDGTKWAPTTVFDAGAIQKTIVDAKGDLIAATAADTVARLPVGTNGHVLTADSAESTGLKWASLPGGYADPLTTKGDLVARSSSDTTRLPVGTNGYVLTADSAETTGLKWAAPSGGSGSAKTNHALYKTYTLSPSPNASYPDLSATRYYDGSAWSARGKLTDGLTGWGYTQGFFCGWTGAVTPVVRVDLGAAQTVERLVVHGTYGTGGVYKPDSIKLEYSDDDTNWTQVFNYTGIGDTSSPGDQPWWADLPFTSSSHRYWRVTFSLSNSGGWLFLGEVQLWG